MLLSLNSTFDYYSVTETQDSSAAQSPSYTLTTSGVACRFQPLPSIIVESFMQRKEQRRANVYFSDTTTYNAIGFQDNIKANGVNYLVKSKQNASSTLYLMELEENISGNSNLP